MATFLASSGQIGPVIFDSSPRTQTLKLELKLEGKGTGSGTIDGTMPFDRKEYGMNRGIPFIKIANRVEVSVALKGKRIGGPPVVFKE